MKNTQKKQWWKLIPWGIVIFGSYYFYDNYNYKQSIEESVVTGSIASMQEKNITFTIASGDSPAFIAQHLENERIIFSHKYFLRYIKENNLDSKLYAGQYSLANTMTLAEIAYTLTHKPELKKILIPEGLTIHEIDERLAKKNIFPSGAFENCILHTCDFSEFSFISEFTEENKREYMEGYFFPATYSIKETELTPQTLATQMLHTFETRAKKLDILDGKNGDSLHEIVTMASIIEKESSTHSGEEPKMISGILWNRINKSIPLGADATIRYGLQKDSSALTRTELTKDNPFNTRKYKGLPPYPIANAGEASLLAAITPSNTKYLFYLHDKNQKIHYAISNTQHEQNKEKFCGGSCE